MEFECPMDIKEALGWTCNPQFTSLRKVILEFLFPWHNRDSEDTGKTAPICSEFEDRVENFCFSGYLASRG